MKNKKRIKRRIKRWWSNSWLNYLTHDCNNHQKPLIPEENSGFESYCTKCGSPN